MTAAEAQNGRPFSDAKNKTRYKSGKKVFYGNPSVENLWSAAKTWLVSSICCTHVVNWHQSEDKQTVQTDRQTNYPNTAVKSEYGSKGKVHGLLITNTYFTFVDSNHQISMQAVK